MAFDLDIFVRKDSRDGFKVIRNIHHQVRQKLVLLIMMHPGERIMDGEMGVGLSRFLFDQNDIASVASATSTLSVVSSVRSSSSSPYPPVCPNSSLTSSLIGDDEGTCRIDVNSSITIDMPSKVAI